MADFVSWLQSLGVADGDRERHMPKTLSPGEELTRAPAPPTPASADSPAATRPPQPCAPALQARREITQAAVADLATNVGVLTTALQKSNEESAAHVLRRQAALAKRVGQVDAVAKEVCGALVRAKCV